jgi:hypothetical protein
VDDIGFTGDETAVNAASNTSAAPPNAINGQKSADVIIKGRTAPGMATLVGRILRVFPPVSGDHNALFSKDITAESLHGNLLREHALQAGATVC